jgi:hypothetical protein
MGKFYYEFLSQPEICRKFNRIEVSVIGIGACNHPKKRKAMRREIYTVFFFCFRSNLLCINKVTETLAGELAKIINIKLGTVDLTETVTGKTLVSSKDTVINESTETDSNTLAAGTAPIFV